MLEELSYRFGAEADRFAFHFSVHFVQKKTCKGENIFAAFSERRDGNFNYSQTVVKILAKTTRGDLFLERTVCCRNDSDIDSARSIFTNSTNLSFL